VARLPAGPTRVEIRRRGEAEVEGFLLALRRGQTVGDVRRVLPRTTGGPGPLERVVRFVVSGSPAPGGTYRTTVVLQPGVRYVVANVGEDLGDTRLRSFRVRIAATTATPPEPVATVGVYDYAYGVPAELPRRGVIRFENRGTRLHMAVAFPLRRGANRTTAIQAWLRNQQERAAALTVGRRAFGALGVVSGGAVNDVDVDFRRGGDWLFVCFIEDGEPGSPPHYTLGMVTPFRVR
jgi:hypothetical protein